jgi:ABC-type uncharacterized transport system substrate-binding protein
MGQFRRRKFLVAAGTLLVAQLARAQSTKKSWRIGVLSLDSAATGIGRQQQQFLHEALSRAGYAVGRDLAIEWRFADGQVERLAQLTNDLVRLKVDVIITASSVEATLAAMRATRTLPIVAHYFPEDPVERGVVASLTRPEGNVTGNLYGYGIELATKQYQILKEAAPAAVRIAALWTPTTTEWQRGAAEFRERIKTLGFVITDFTVTNPDEVRPTLRRIAAFKPDAFFVGTNPVTRIHLAEIAQFAVEQKLVTIAPGLSGVRNGLLLYYGPDVPYAWDRTVNQMGRILRGVKLADIPFEQPTKYELVVNAKTARAIGYKLPPALQVRVDRVIE